MIHRSKRNKQGVIAPLFAFILPVLLIFSAFAINLSYMQLTTTQLKIASDASSHAGGRALSFYQDTDQAIIEMDRYAQLNPVSGTQIVIPQDDAHMQFGQAILANGKYEFVQHPKDVVDADESDVIVNSVRVFAEIDTPLAFRFREASGNFNPIRSSITHQKDRDIAMVIDKSGSMLEFVNVPRLDAALTELRDNNEIASHEYYLAGLNQDGTERRTRVYKQYYTNNVLNKLNQLAESYQNSNSDLAREYRQTFEYALSLQQNLKGPKHPLDLDVTTFADQTEFDKGNNWYSRYREDMMTKAPAFSRWEAMVGAMNGFFDVLEKTDQQEQVALIVFSSDAEAESVLTDDYNLLRTVIEEIVPIGGTQIGEGLYKGLREVVNYDDSGEPANSRKFAEKMIVVMTDGTQNRGGLLPEPVARDFKRQNPEAIIHAVTFGKGATQKAMKDVAKAGGGNHYHADSAGELAEEFREIANIPPTIFTY